MAEGFDDFETQEYPVYDEYDNIGLEELNDKDQSLLKHESMILGEIANGNTSNYHEFTEIIKRREYIDKLKLRIKTENPFKSTSWIDEDIDYEMKDKTVISNKGTKNSINNFIGNIFKRDGNFRENKKIKWIPQDFRKLTRSFLPFDTGRGTRMNF